MTTDDPRSAPGELHWRASSSELDDLSMILLGAYRGVDGFAAADLPPDAERPPAPVLVLPPDVAQQCRAHGSLVVVDEEGMPQARVTVAGVHAAGEGRWLVAGTVAPLAGEARGSHPELRVGTPEGAPTRPRLAVLVDRPLPIPVLVAIVTAAGELSDAEIVLLPLTGHGRPRGVDGPALVRTCLAASRIVGATVIPVSVPFRASTPTGHHVSAEVDDAWVRWVATAYGASHVVRPGVPPVGSPVGSPPRRGGALVAELPPVARHPDTGRWSPSRAAPAADRSASTFDERVVAMKLERREAVDPELFDTVTQRELERSRLRGHPGFAVLLTGLSGSGKSTIARTLCDRILESSERPVTLLDGDVVRTMLSSELTFSREHRALNVRRIGFVAAEIGRHGGIAVCAPIAPYDDDRKEVRRMVETAGAGLVLVHVATPLEVCEARDRKGLYARARAGEIPAFTGVSDPYEPPTDADLVVDTSGIDVATAVDDILALLTARGWFHEAPGPH